MGASAQSPLAAAAAPRPAASCAAPSPKKTSADPQHPRQRRLPRCSINLAEMCCDECSRVRGLCLAPIMLHCLPRVRSLFPLLLNSITLLFLFFPFVFSFLLSFFLSCLSLTVDVSGETALAALYDGLTRTLNSVLNAKKAMLPGSYRPVS